MLRKQYLGEFKNFSFTIIQYQQKKFKVNGF